MDKLLWYTKCIPRSGFEKLNFENFDEDSFLLKFLSQTNKIPSISLSHFWLKFINSINQFTPLQLNQINWPIKRGKGRNSRGISLSREIQGRKERKKKREKKVERWSIPLPDFVCSRSQVYRFASSTNGCSVGAEGLGSLLRNPDGSRGRIARDFRCPRGARLFQRRSDPIVASVRHIYGGIPLLLGLDAAPNR